MSYFDDNEDRIIGLKGRGAPHAEIPYCRFCGNREVIWIHSGVRWRLYEADAQTLHSCGKVATSDDFDIC